MDDVRAISPETPLERLRRIVRGIDKTETESDEGWWETSTGAEFGADVLDELEKLVDDLTRGTDA